MRSLIHRYIYTGIYMLWGDMEGYGDMEPMERAGTLGPTWDPRAARSIGSISPHIPPISPTTYIYLYVYLWINEHIIVCI